LLNLESFCHYFLSTFSASLLTSPPPVHENIFVVGWQGMVKKQVALEYSQKGATSSWEATSSN
jgi:hypothetical protein